VSATTAPADGQFAVARLEPLRPMPVHQVQAAMQEYQRGLAAVLDDSDWQIFGDRGGASHRFVKRSGWRKVATWFGLDLLVGEVIVERDEHGQPLRARVVGRAVAPNGRVAEDIGACSHAERRFSKPEHDLIATACTRALNRATSNLVGMGEVTAEEMLAEIEPMMPEWAEYATEANVATMRAKLAELVGESRADVLVDAIGNRYDGVPNIATGIVNALRGMLGVLVKPEPQTGDDVATETTATESGE
jgi:hypothetical protein